MQPGFAHTTDMAFDRSKPNAGKYMRVVSTRRYDPHVATPEKARKRRLLSAEEIDRYEHVADGLLERVKVVQSSFLPNGADGLTFGRYVFVKPGHFDESLSELMAHELVHVRQFAELGLIRFVSRYVTEYLRNLLELKSHRAAYLAISFEIDARENADKWARSQSS